MNAGQRDNLLRRWIKRVARDFSLSFPWLAIQCRTARARIIILIVRERENDRDEDIRLKAQQDSRTGAAPVEIGL